MEIYGIKSYENIPIFLDIYLFLYLIFIFVFSFIFVKFLKLKRINYLKYIKKLSVKILIRGLPLLWNNRFFFSYLSYLISVIFDFYGYSHLNSLPISWKQKYINNPEIWAYIAIFEKFYYRFYSENKNISFSEKVETYNFLKNNFK